MFPLREETPDPHSQLVIRKQNGTSSFPGTHLSWHQQEQRPDELLGPNLTTFSSWDPLENPQSSLSLIPRPVLGTTVSRNRGSLRGTGTAPLPPVAVTAWHYHLAQVPLGARTVSATTTTTIPLSSNAHGLKYVAEYPEIPASPKNSLYYHNSIKHSSGYCKLFQKWRKKVQGFHGC